MLVAMPALPARAVTIATQPPKMTAVQLVSAVSLTPGQTAKIRFTLSQPAQRVEFRYLDASLSEARTLTWTGNPGAGPFTAEAAAIIGSGDYYDGLQRLTSVSIYYQGQSYAESISIARDSRGGGLTQDNAGDPLIRASDFTVKNPARVLLTPANIVAPKFEPTSNDWSTLVGGYVHPGQWTTGVTKFHAEWLGAGEDYVLENSAGLEPFYTGVWRDLFGKSLTLRLTTTSPGFKSISVDSGPYLFAGAGPVTVSGKPWFGTKLKADFNLASIKGLPDGATPTVMFEWKSRSTADGVLKLAPGVDYAVKAADGGRPVSVTAVVSFAGKTVARIRSSSSPNISNPTPLSKYDSGTPSNITARTADGRLLQYTLNWGSSPEEVGSGWNMFNLVFSPGDFDGDGNPDVMGRTPSGQLWLYPGDGRFGWKAPSVVGTGWQGMTELIGPGDFDSDGNDDVLAKDRDGRLVLYPGNGSGGWKPPRQVGQGWNIFNQVFSTGDFDGDSRSDLLARDSAGRLFLYSSNGTGGWLGSKPIGEGWSSMKLLGGSGEVTNDGWNDIFAVDEYGRLYIYPFRAGSWQPRQHVGPGWGDFTSLF